MIHLSIVTPPAAEPVTLAEVKAHLRILHASEDALLSRLIATARQHLEGADGRGGILGRSLVQQTLRLRLPEFPTLGRPLEMPRPPLVSVSSIVYTDVAGAVQTMPGADYDVDTDAWCGQVRYKPAAFWPAVKPGGYPVQITYVSGYAVVPDPIRSAILLLVGHWYDTRSAVGDTVGQKAQVPLAVEALLAPYMTHGWI